MIHELKILNEFFGDVLRGKKTFEVRTNDRNFNVGDYLALNEIDMTDAANWRYTGRCCVVYVDYILNDSKFLPENTVVMSIKPCAVIRTQEEKYEYDQPPAKWLEVPCIVCMPSDKNQEAET